jgi:hypothetical protein
MCGHDLEERDGADEVVVVVEERLGHALPDSLQAGEVNHGLKPAQQQFQKPTWMMSDEVNYYQNKETS